MMKVLPSWHFWNFHSNNASRKLVTGDESKCCFVVTGEITEMNVIQWWIINRQILKFCMKISVCQGKHLHNTNRNLAPFKRWTTLQWRLATANIGRKRKWRNWFSFPAFKSELTKAIDFPLYKNPHKIYKFKVTNVSTESYQQWSITDEKILRCQIGRTNIWAAFTVKLCYPVRVYV